MGTFVSAGRKGKPFSRLDHHDKAGEGTARLVDSVELGPYWTGLVFAPQTLPVSNPFQLAVGVDVAFVNDRANAVRVSWAAIYVDLGGRIQVPCQRAKVRSIDEFGRSVDFPLILDAYTSAQQNRYYLLFYGVADVDPKLWNTAPESMDLVFGVVGVGPESVSVRMDLDVRWQTAEDPSNSHAGG